MNPLATLSLALLAAALGQPAFALTARTVAKDQKVIEALKAKITEDPQGLTETWNDVCADDTTFVCAENPFTNETALALMDINGYELEGDLTLDFLVELTDLTAFHANSNGFKGTVPNDLSGLQWLYELDVSNNQLSGSFPEGVLTAVNLTYLDIRFNSFQGEVPAEVFEMDLDVLFLNDNLFTGILPDNIWDTPALYLSLANNDFSGSIPKVDDIKNLREVLLSGNLLTGYLPDEWSGAKNLTLFDAGHNQLIGGVPEALCALDALETLNLTGNLLMGALGPKCAALQKKGVLDVSQNCIDGEEDQKTAEQCSAAVKLIR